MSYPAYPGISVSLGEELRETLEQAHGIRYRSDVHVELVELYGGDWLVCDAARVSTKQTKGVGPRTLSVADIGLIKALVRQRHAMPFGHGGLTFYVEAPLFVLRQWRTHKIRMIQADDTDTYSEASQRYRPLKPVFWLPPDDRPMYIASDHKSMRPEYIIASEYHYKATVETLKDVYTYAWESYAKLAQDGIANEVARSVLPAGIYSAMYVSTNPLAAMRFCSLRVHSADSTVTSYPQAEIEEAAKGLEKVLSIGWPETYKAWLDNGRQTL